MHLVRHKLSAAFFLALGSLTQAGEADPVITEDYFLGEIPVVLSASRLAQPVSESPAAMTVIDRATIEASGAINIPDVLRLAPGFQVSHISGQNLTAQYHGFADQNPKRMQVLIDGRSVYHSAFGGVHWDSLPITLNDIERIEVLRGSNAAAYGSNAFMGVVNIVTRKASRDRGHELTALTGYQGTRSLEWRFGDRIGDLDYRLSLGAFETDGFPDYDWTHTYWDSTGGPVAPETVLTGTPLLAETQRYSLAREDSQSIGRINWRGDHQLENGNSLLFELGYTRNDRDNTLHNGNFDLLRPDQNLRTSHQLAKWSGQLASGGELSVQLYHNRLDFDSRHIDTWIERDSGILINVGPTLGGHKLINDRYDLEVQHNLPTRGGWRTVWGAGARIEQLDSENFVVDDRDIERRQLRLFGNTEKHFGERDQWVLNAGLMLEHQQDQGNFASPRVAVNYHVDELNTLRIAAARAYRMPSFYEQFGETARFALDPSPLKPLVPSPTPSHYVLYSNRGFDIEPEEIRSIEFGLHRATGIEGLSLDIRIFREELRNYIDAVLHDDGCNGCDTNPLRPKHDIWVHENAGWMDMHGVDLQTNIRVSDRTDFIGSASMVRADGRRIRKRDSSGLVTDDQPIDDFVPKVTFSALWSHRFDHGWSGSIGLYRMGLMNWPNEGDRLEPYDRVDVRLAKSMRLEGSDLQLELIAQNLLDDDYTEFRGDNAFERRVYLRAKLEFD